MLEKWIANKNVNLLFIPKDIEKELSNINHYSQPPYEVIMAFVYTLNEMKKVIYDSIMDLQENGRLFLCYPKLKNSLLMPGIHRDDIFPFLNVNEQTGYVSDTLMRFNKMEAFDENYTILGMKKDVTKKKRSDTSGRIDDYVAYVPEIINQLKNEPCLKFFLLLAPGYQKGWARYIYSAKTQETKERRFNEMIILLNQGIKSKDLEKK